MTDTESWRLADKTRVHSRVFTYIRQLDRFQFETFNRFKQLEALYDVAPKPGARAYKTPKGYGRMHENVVASNCDTVSAQIATTEVRAVFDTDDADWSTQRRARRLEWYAEGLGKLLQIPQKCRHAFKAGGTVKGTAVNKVWVDGFKRVRVKPVMIDDIVVDESECRGGDEPRQLHYRTAIDRDELKALYPKFKTQIDRSQGGYGQWQTWAGWRPLRRSDLLVIESWIKPIGVKGETGYIAGRHTVTIDGCDLFDEEYHEDYFPFAIMKWSKPVNGWYGIGLAERIAGIQLALNRRNLQNERKLDHGAFPTTWVQRQDAALATAQASVMQNTLGTVAVYGGSQPPTTVTPPAVSPEELRDADRLSAKASEVSGVSRMASQSVKPAGIETGVALREYRDQTTQRFAEQEKDYELFVLDTVWLVIACCKQLGAAAPVITRKTRFGSRKIEWAEVDMKEIRVWIGAASTLNRTRAGREQTVVEWAQAGIISQDSAKRLIGHPDLEREMSLYTAAIENADECLEEIADGNVVMPEPFMNLKLLVWRAQQQYLNWSAGGSKRAAPEDVLENLRSLIVQAVWMDTGGDVEAANQNAVGPDMSMPAQPGMPGAGPPMPPGGVPPLPVAPPMATPQAAFAPQAMQLVAGV